MTAVYNCDQCGYAKATTSKAWMLRAAIEHLNLEHGGEEDTPRRLDALWSELEAGHEWPFESSGGEESRAPLTFERLAEVCQQFKAPEPTHYLIIGPRALIEVNRLLREEGLAEVDPDQDYQMGKYKVKFSKDIDGIHTLPRWPWAWSPGSLEDKEA